MPATAKISTNANDLVYLSQIALEVQSEWAEFYPEQIKEHLHPCFIQGDSCFITRKGLKKQHPAAYACLVSIAIRYGIRVMEDRRNKSIEVKQDRRQKIVLAVGLLVGICAEQTALANNESLINTVDQDIAMILHDPADSASEARLNRRTDQNLKTHLQAKKTSKGTVRIGTRTVSISVKEQLHMEKILSCLNGKQHQEICVSPDYTQIQRVEDILSRHLSEHSRTDAQAMPVIEKIAYYYAHYPEVVALLKDIDRLNWTLNSIHKDFKAQAIIQQHKVQQVDVFFDPYHAAQMIFAHRCSNMPVCTVSPADALLHELLHAKIMLEQPHEYAKQNAHSLYPVEHEHDVITLENSFYQAMSARDSLPRPIRSSHTATLVEVDCPVCIASTTGT